MAKKADETLIICPNIKCYGLLRIREFPRSKNKRKVYCPYCGFKTVWIN